MGKGKLIESEKGVKILTHDFKWGASGRVLCLSSVSGS